MEVSEMANESKAREAQQQIEEKCRQARELVSQAERLADTYGLEFHFSVSYGMGGYYRPNKRTSPLVQQALAKLTQEERDAVLATLPDEDSEEVGWRSSSQSC